MLNCTENGYAFSCFQNFGISNTSNYCEKRCHENYLQIFGLEDFYYFSHRLTESNFSMPTQNHTKSKEEVNICTNIKFNFHTRTWKG